MKQKKWQDYITSEAICGEQFINRCNLFSNIALKHELTYCLEYSTSNKLNQLEVGEKSDMLFDKLITFVKDNKFKVIVNKRDDDKSYLIYDNESCFIFVKDSNSKTTFNYELNSFNDNKMKVITDFLKDNFNRTEKKNYIYNITNTSSGLALSNIGAAKSNYKLSKQNYSKAVLEQWYKVVKNIKSKKPTGRLTILHGDPGSGKSFLLKSLINDIKDVSFVLIQPAVFSKYDINDIFCLLKSCGHKIVLLVEDADSILADRKHNNENLVSNILNLTDGFMSDNLDLHIIATTNIKKLEIDAAYKRSGRLSAIIEVSHLSVEEANIAYSKIKNKNKPDMIFEKPVTLADVFAAANGCEVEDKIKKSIGFSMREAHVLN